MKKKGLTLALAALMAASFVTACSSGSTGSEETTSSGNTSDETTAAVSDNSSDKLIVARDANYPPMEYIGEDGTTIIGFDAELAQAIADQMGRELEILDVAWDGIFGTVDTGRADLIISAVSINEDRQENYNLTEAYIANKICIVSASDSGISSVEDLAGKKVGVQTETTSDQFMNEQMENGLDVNADDYFVYDTIISAFTDLKNGRLDAVVVDNVVAQYYIGTDSDTYSISWTSDEAEPMAIVLKKGNDELTAEVQAAVDALYEDGTVAEIAAKYFGENNSVTVK